MRLTWATAKEVQSQAGQVSETLSQNKRSGSLVGWDINVTCHQMTQMTFKCVRLRNGSIEMVVKMHVPEPAL